MIKNILILIVIVTIALLCYGRWTLNNKPSYRVYVRIACVSITVKAMCSVNEFEFLMDVKKTLTELYTVNISFK